MRTPIGGRWLVSGLVLASALAASRPAPVGARPAEARIYVTVVDGKNQPVSGLTAADFAVQLDGVNQEIIRVQPATDPLSVMLMTDRLGLSSTYTVFDIGQVLEGYIKAVRQRVPESKFALTTFDGTTVQLVKFTAPPNDLNRAVGRLGTIAEDGMLLDGLVDVSKVMMSAPTERRVIFVVLAAYRPERSNAANNVVIELIRQSKASVWVVEVRATDATNYANAPREQVLDVTSQWSGGFRDTVSSRAGLGNISKRMADLVLSQYAISYAPSSAGSSRSILQVGVNRPGVKVFSPRWLSQ
jgi:VWFA-related protein